MNDLPPEVRVVDLLLEVRIIYLTSGVRIINLPPGVPTVDLTPEDHVVDLPFGVSHGCRLNSYASRVSADVALFASGGFP